MLRNLTDLRGYTIHATDGGIGTVDDLNFDDEDGHPHYLGYTLTVWLWSC
jgi:sporulation protein YlmC with PRC-barrel domain